MASDPQLRSFADDEAKSAGAAMERLEVELQAALLPKDPDDARNDSGHSSALRSNAKHGFQLEYGNTPGPKVPLRARNKPETEAISTQDPAKSKQEKVKAATRR